MYEISNKKITTKAYDIQHEKTDIRIHIMNNKKYNDPHMNMRFVFVAAIAVTV